MITAYKKSSISALKSVTPLEDGDIAFVETGGLLYTYILDIDSIESESSPNILIPNSVTHPAPKRWRLQGVSVPVGKLYIGNVAVTVTAAELNLIHGQVGILTGASGTKAIFYQNTAPSGWTIQNTLDDKLLYITKGSAAGGQTGGGVHSAGTWTLTTGSHILLATEMPAHTHTQVCDGRGASANAYGAYSADPVAYMYEGLVTGSTGGGGGHTHESATWRPAAYCAIICSKN